MLDFNAENYEIVEIYIEGYDWNSEKEKIKEEVKNENTPFKIN